MVKIRLIVLAFVISFLSWHSNSFALQSFQAEFNTKALGINLGTVKHQMQCTNQTCKLTNIAIPGKLINWLVKESSIETIKLDLQPDYLKWLSHRIDIQRQKLKKTEKIQRNFYLDSSSNKVISPEKSMDFNAQKYGYDMVSIMYAMQFYMQKQQRIPDLYLQEDNQQTAINFTTKYRQTKVNLGYQSQLNADYFEWKTQLEKGKVLAKVWLIKDLNYFPGKIEIYQQADNQKLTLTLKSKPIFN